jgi:hypothetical protein
MMRIFVGVALLVLFGFISGANAIPKPEPESSQGLTTIGKQDMFFGVVEKVDSKGNVVVVKGTMMQEKKMLAFDVNDKTRIWRGKMMLHIGDLERTMQVRVEYKQERDRLTALTIEITDR